MIPKRGLRACCVAKRHTNKPPCILMNTWITVSEICCLKMTQQTIKSRHRGFSSALLFLWFVQLLAIATTTYAGLAGHSCFSSLNFTSEQGHLYVNGIQFKLKGVSWFGFETRHNVVHGLWTQRYTDLLDFLSDNGFNIIRVPLQ